MRAARSCSSDSPWAAVLVAPITVVSRSQLLATEPAPPQFTSETVTAKVVDASQPSGTPPPPPRESTGSPRAGGSSAGSC